MTSANDVIDAERITGCHRVPLLVDIDTGWGAFNIARTIRAFERMVWPPSTWKIRVAQKRCRSGQAEQGGGHGLEMVDRIKGRGGCPPGRALRHHGPHRRPGGGRTGLGPGRAAAYVEAGADMIFAEAVTELDQYDRFRQAAGVPILANMTEFGKTELFDKEALALPASTWCSTLSAARAANQAALSVYQTLRRDGHQRAVVDTMQTRESSTIFSVATTTRADPGQAVHPGLVDQGIRRRPAALCWRLAHQRTE